MSGVRGQTTQMIESDVKHGCVADNSRQSQQPTGDSACCDTNDPGSGRDVPCQNVKR